MSAFACTVAFLVIICLPFTLYADWTWARDRPDEYLYGRNHVAELNGGEVKFFSTYKPGSYGLWSETVEHCKRAGLYKRENDADKIILDGEPLTWDKPDRS